jgi:hypothetical protein
MEEVYIQVKEGTMIKLYKKNNVRTKPTLQHGALW